MSPYISYDLAMALLLSGDLESRGEPRRIAQVNHVTGRQPVSKPSSNRKAELLRKSLARQASPSDALKEGGEG